MDDTSELIRRLNKRDPDAITELFQLYSRLLWTVVSGILSGSENCFREDAEECTEGGTIACECEQQHLHINDDCVIVEPVDQNNQPVPDGVQSDKILLTNLYNYT